MTPPMNLDTLGDKRRPTVFISYHRETATPFAQRLIADLEKAGHDSWIDTVAIKGGDEWIASIAEGLERAAALVILVNRAALQSRWVKLEINYAFATDKLIIPLFLEADISPKDAFILLNAQRINCFACDYETTLAQLLRALPEPVPQPVRPPDRRALELAYLDRLTLEELIHTDKYTPLAGASQRAARRVEARASFKLMPLRLGKAAHELEAPREFDNAVDEILALPRAVLLGEPGGGKTTTLLKLAAELAQRARLDAQAPLPLLIRLGRWTNDEQTLPAFIAAELGALGASLESLLNEKRAALLLDGLNELPAAQRAAKYPQVEKLITAHRELLSVVSCRKLDYTLDLKCHRIEITELDPLRIREFVTRYLDEAQGEALFWKLAGQTARHELERFSEKFADKLTNLDHVFWLNHQLPDGWLWGYEWGQEEHKDNSYWESWLRQRETPSSLMALARNPYMLWMLASVYAEYRELPNNRGELFRLFVETLLQRECIPDEEQRPLIEGLARVAFTMQTRRNTKEEANALTVLPHTEVKAILNDRLLYLAGSASLLQLGDEVRFTHQLLQEYFAAQFMDAEIKAGRLNATDIWKPAQWWQRTNWEEAAILLAGLYSDDCSPIIEWLSDAQPETAAQCIQHSGAALAEATREKLRAKWLPRLADVQLEREAKARAAIGRALGQTGLDNRGGVGVRDGLPDIEWKEILAGEFQYGLANDTRAAEPQRLTLPTYYLSRFPVTMAQFQCFVDDNGYGDGRWWQGLAADEKARQPREQGFKFDNHPRETVNWYEAMAFCRWLSWRKGGGFDLRKVDEWAVRLPTEFEWEKAARGTDGRVYPYGKDYDATKGNVNQSIGETTNAVGIYPHGASPYGVEEMSGNVWEWCLSEYQKPQLEARKEKLTTKVKKLTTKVKGVLRGGSFIFNVDYARSVSSYVVQPGVRNFAAFGFRVCLVRPPS